MLRIIVGYCVLCLLSVSLSSCVVPNTDLAPSVLPQSEIQLLSQVAQAREAVNAGRVIEAEEKYLRALQSGQSSVAIMNNLGHVYLLQGRNFEALKSFEKALERRPYFGSALYNKGVALYRLHRYQEAVDAFLALIKYHQQAILHFPENSLQTALNVRKLSTVLRNTSLAYLALGIEDEALCYSRLVLLIEPSNFQLAQHARLLMALGHRAEAQAVLKTVVVGARDRAPAGLLLDYGVLLLKDNEQQVAGAAFEKVLASQNATTGDRLLARLLLEDARRLRDEGKAQERGRLDLGEEDIVTACEIDFSVKRRYWPSTIVESLINRTELYCGDDELKPFSS